MRSLKLIIASYTEIQLVSSVVNHKLNLILNLLFGNTKKSLFLLAKNLQAVRSHKF